MASLVATGDTPKPPTQPKPEFLTPRPMPAIRKEGTPGPSPATPRSTAMNFVEILTEARTTRTLTDKYRLILSSLKYIYSGVKPPTLIQPVQLLNELSKMTSLLDGFNEMLVTELFKCKPLSLETPVLTAYLQVLVELARTNTFLHEEVARQLLMSMASIDDEQPPQPQLDLMHEALQNMLKQLPHFQDALLRQISKCLPFMTKPWRQQVHMYTQMLRIVDYVSAQLSLEVLSRLVHKIIDLDCHCPKEEMLAAEEAVDETATQFPMDSTDSTTLSKDDTVKTEDTTLKDDLEKEMKHPLGNTFDRLMELFFQYIDDHMTELAEAKVTYKRFLAVFDKYIMATYKCLHIQFLLFYICSKRPLFTDSLIDFLWQKVQDPNTSVVFRQMSVAYLGSLLSRASFVSVGTLKDTLGLVSKFLHGYLAETTSAQTPGLDVNRHATFYAVCQSLLYCIAFRHKDIAESGNGLDFLRSLNLEQLVTSPLNPLKVMSKPIAMNFANVSRHYQIVYCHAIIERNQRSALPMAHSGYDANGSHVSASHCSQYSTIIEGYFPFDPYALLRSRRWIDPIYRQYVDHISSPVEEDENAEEEEEPMETAAAETGVAESAASSGTGQTAEKLFAYSVSPGFVH